jgi:hypothetical protein
LIYELASMGPHSEDRVRVRRRRPFHESTRVVGDESESVSATSVAN